MVTDEEIARLEIALQQRIYMWAQSTLADQVRTDYPLLRVIKSRTVTRFLTFVKRFSQHEQLFFARALVKRFHPNALSLTHEWLDSSEEALIQEYLNTDSPVQEVRRTWKKSELKRLLRKILPETYVAATVEWEGGDADISMVIGGVKVITHLDAQTEWCRFRYFHRFYCGEREIYHITAPLGWWGISGETDWNQAETPESIVLGFKALSEHFLSALPSLLWS